MRTASLLPVSPSMHCSGVQLVLGVVPGQGLYLVPGGVPGPRRGGTCPGTPPEQNSWHTLLKILPCPKLRLRAVITGNALVTSWLFYIDSKGQPSRRIQTELERDREYWLPVCYAELFKLQLKLHQEWDLDQDEWLTKPFCTLPGELMGELVLCCNLNVIPFILSMWRVRHNIGSGPTYALSEYTTRPSFTLNINVHLKTLFTRNVWVCVFAKC